MDPALIRPGRVDLKQLIGHATKHQLVQMYLRFYQELGPDTADEFATKALSYDRPISIAAVQGFFMMHKNDGHAVIENLEQLWKR